MGVRWGVGWRQGVGWSSRGEGVGGECSLPCPVLQHPGPHPHPPPRRPRAPPLPPTVRVDDGDHLPAARGEVLLHLLRVGEEAGLPRHVPGPGGWVGAGWWGGGIGGSSGGGWVGWLSSRRGIPSSIEQPALLLCASFQTTAASSPPSSNPPLPHGVLDVQPQHVVGDGVVVKAAVDRPDVVLVLVVPPFGGLVVGWGWQSQHGIMALIDCSSAASKLFPSS
jgi:hypothetical protein